MQSFIAIFWFSEVKFIKINHYVSDNQCNKLVTTIYKRLKIIISIRFFVVFIFVTISKNNNQIILYLVLKKLRKKRFRDKLNKNERKLYSTLPGYGCQKIISGNLFPKIIEQSNIIL